MFEKIKTDMISALKAKDSVKLETLRYIISQIKKVAIDSQKGLSDDEVVGIVRKEVKNLNEAASQFRSGGRADLAEANDAQVNVLKTYLPVEITDADLEAKIKEFVEQNKAAYDANPRTFTGRVVGNLKSIADPSRISKVYGEKFVGK